MRIKTALAIVVLTTCSGQASEFDLNDHASLCAQMAKTHNWADGSSALSNCPCSMAELQETMTPDLFEVTMRWQLDPTNLPTLLPTGMGVSEFYDTVGPAFGLVEAKCGPMR